MLRIHHATCHMKNPDCARLMAVICPSDTFESVPSQGAKAHTSIREVLQRALHREVRAVYIGMLAVARQQQMLLDYSRILLLLRRAWECRCVQ